MMRKKIRKAISMIELVMSIIGIFTVICLIIGFIRLIKEEKIICQ